MFMFYGDNLWLYNIPGRALLGLILGPMALVGVVIAIVRFKRMEYALAIFWLVAGIFPSLITGVVASNLRSIAALPVVYLFVAIGLVEIMRSLERLIESHTLRTIPLVLLAVGVTLFSWNAYFDQWAQARDVRVAYNTTLFEVAQDLDRASDLPTDVAISSIYPNRFHDPYAMQLTLKRKDMPLRWFTGSFVDMNGVPHASLIFPQPSSDCGVVCARCQLGRSNVPAVSRRRRASSPARCPLRPSARIRSSVAPGAAELQHDDCRSSRRADRSGVCRCVQAAFGKNPIG